MPPALMIAGESPAGPGAVPPAIAVAADDPAEEAPPAPRPAPERVYVEQIAASEILVPQPTEAAGNDDRRQTFAEKVELMQVALPPPIRLTASERVTYLANAPVQITVRVGQEAVGQVAFRMTEADGIEVQLSGLLDLVADRFAPEEFARLRASAAADRFVSLGQVRAAGLSLRYDPVYDELLIAA